MRAPVEEEDSCLSFLAAIARSKENNEAESFRISEWMCVEQLILRHHSIHLLSSVMSRTQLPTISVVLEKRIVLFFLLPSHTSIPPPQPNESAPSN